MTRAFAASPVPPAMVEELIAEAARAPSAGKTQGWHAVVLHDAETARFWDATLPLEKRPTFGWPTLIDAPVLMVILADPDAYVRRYAEPDKAHTGLGVNRNAWPVAYWTVDASMAAMTVLFGAEARGLGALFFGVFNGEEALRHTLNIPNQMDIIGAIAVGYPLVARPGRSANRLTRTPDQIIHRGGWASPASGDSASSTNSSASPAKVPRAGRAGRAGRVDPPQTASD